MKTSCVNLWLGRLLYNERHHILSWSCTHRALALCHWFLLLPHSSYVAIQAKSQLHRLVSIFRNPYQIVSIWLFVLLYVNVLRKRAGENRAKETTGLVVKICHFCWSLKRALSSVVEGKRTTIVSSSSIEFINVVMIMLRECIFFALSIPFGWRPYRLVPVSCLHPSVIRTGQVPKSSSLKYRMTVACFGGQSWFISGEFGSSSQESPWVRPVYKIVNHQGII